MHIFLIVMSWLVLTFLPLSSMAANMMTVEEFTKALSPPDTSATSSSTKRTMKARGLGGVQPVPHTPSANMHLNFAYNSSELSEPAQNVLNNLGHALKNERLRSYVYRFEGHTCDLGDERYNEQLSRDRVLAVRNYLTSNFHFSPEQFKVDWFGESRPAVPNVNEEARKKNRRVAIINTLEAIDLPAASDKIVAMEVKYLTEGGEQPLVAGGAMKSGQQYAIQFRTAADLSVYIYQIDAAGEKVMLFPNPEFGEMGNPVYDDTFIRLPGSGYWFYLDENSGDERIVLIASKTSLDDPLAAYNQLYNLKEDKSNHLLAAKTKPIVVNPRGLGGVVHEKPRLTEQDIKTELVQEPEKTDSKIVSKIYVIERDFTHL